MTDEEILARFEAERCRLRAIAARMLGDDHEAADVVQESWLRLQRSDAAAIESLPAWLTTVTSRICLDRLRSRTTRPDTAWNEEAAEGWASDAPTPEDEAVLADAVGQAMTVVLDSLAPAERLAYVLHDVFAVPFGQVASILGRSEVATRKLASRARSRLATPATEVAVADREVVDAFMQASRDNDFEALLALLDPRAEVCTDQAAAQLGSSVTVEGARSVAEFFAGRARAALPATLDGAAAAVWQHLGEIKVVFAFTVEDGRVRQIELLAAPEVLARTSRRQKQ